MQPGAQQVWPNHGNIADHLVINYGDIETGFRQADIILENTFSTPLVEHAFLETEGAVAYPDSDGTMVVFSSCQAPHRDRIQIARSLKLPENKVRVITPHIGGAFGGKDEAHVQIHAALLAQASGRPVSLVRSREDSILTHVKRHPVTIRIRSGITQDGKLTAVHAMAIGDTGPYLNAGRDVMNFVAATLSGPYFVPNARLEAYTVFTNNPICGAMRGYGIPQAAFACEAQMDALARAINIDPLEIRLRNGMETGMQVPTGVTLREAGGMKTCLNEAARLSGWQERRSLAQQPAPHLRRGWGMASIWFSIGMGRNVPDHAAVTLDMLPDGSLILHTGAADMGQGVHTVLAQIAAEGIGVTLEAVKVVTPDTDRTFDAGPSVASRQTFVSGNAVLRAAQPIRETLLQAASELTGLSVEILQIKQGQLLAEGELLSITIPELVAKAIEKDCQLHADGYYAMEYPEQLPPGSYPYATSVFTFGTQIAQVVVDMETGQVSLEKLVAVQDAGKIINPGGARGQIEGGVIMGLGYALMEELLVDHGATRNLNLGTYLIPTSKDVPELTVKIVEVPEPFAPYGAKGLGEPPLTPTAPAILNAVIDAIGVPLYSIPLTAERVLGAIQSNKGDTPANVE
ncbi:MAG: xanthine dehydrogenase family protein molybdopterin-binding subunit [Anaerolineae bacterium]|nr:xanthine dehydrogenase family protein molybdopterin-binding subunit [Anaerolineae bacterium]